MRPLVVALQLVAGAVDPDSTRTVAESRLRAAVDSAAHAFLLEWRDAWQEEQGGDRWFATDPRWNRRGFRVRRLALHCHFIETPAAIRRHLITGRARAHASCPLWYPPADGKVGDERLDLDAAVAQGRRSAIMAKRQLLRTLIDSAALRLPSDMRIAMHRVRFALDARDLSGAASASRACGGPPAQCGLLHGLVLYRMGLVAHADSAFRAAAALMREDERCRWNDIAPLLDPAMRREYEALSCADRSQLETRTWWLADPLYLEPGNERRAEHAARKVMVRLISILEHDGRQRWAPKYGAEAAAEALVRYGWPSHWFWGGRDEDGRHDEWLAQHGAEPAPPYAAREYTRGRLHTVPHRDALRAPFRAPASAWQLNAPADEQSWWPREHYARDASRIVQLPDGQVAVLRRRDGSRFVWAGALDTALLTRPARTRVQGALFHSSTDGEVTRVLDAAATVGDRLIVDALLPGGDALLGVEIAGDTAHPAARTRFGMIIPPALRILGAGRDVSPPLLFAPPADAGPTLGADSAVARMYGTTSFAAGQQRVGVYWEGYGFRSTDMLDIEIEVLRESRPGVLQRVLRAIRILDRDDGGGVGVRWRETPDPGRSIAFIEGDVPVQSRSVVVGIGGLSRGSYRMVVTMRSTDGATAKGERAFIIR